MSKESPSIPTLLEQFESGAWIVNLDQQNIVYFKLDTLSVHSNCVAVWPCSYNAKPSLVSLLGGVCWGKTRLRHGRSLPSHLVTTVAVTHSSRDSSYFNRLWLFIIGDV